MATRMQQRRGTASEWTSANPTLAAGEIGFETDTGQFKIGDGTTSWSSLNYFKDAADLEGDYLTDSMLGTADGVASLDSNGQVPLSQLALLIGSAPETLDTLGELAAGLGTLDSELEALGTDLTTNYTAAISQAVSDLTDAYEAGDTLLSTNLTTAFETADTALSGSLTTAFTAADTALETSITTAYEAAIDDAVAAEATQRSSADAQLSQDITDAIALEVEARNNAITSAVTALDTDDITEGTTNLYYTDARAQNAVVGLYDAAGSATAAQTAAETTASGYVSAHNAETTNVHGIADTSALATDSDVASAVSDHAAVTTNVHGIADTSVLATTTDVSTAQSAAEGHADGIVATHNSATTSVHGIADTSDLALLSAADQTFSGNITIAGDFTVSGTTTTVSTQDLVVNDPMIYIGEGSTGNTADLGVVGSFDDGTYQHAGIVRDASAGIWKFFKGVTDEPSTTINFAQGSLDDLAVNNIEVAGVVFTDGTQTKAGVPSITGFTQKTASYTLDTTDHQDNIIEMDSSSAVTFTIPTDAALAWPVGASMDIFQAGSGQVTIQAVDGTVTVNATPGLKLRTQWSSATILKRAANSWVVYGDLTA